MHLNYLSSPRWDPLIHTHHSTRSLLYSYPAILKKVLILHHIRNLCARFLFSRSKSLDWTLTSRSESNYKVDNIKFVKYGIISLIWNTIIFKDVFGSREEVLQKAGLNDDNWDILKYIKKDGRNVTSSVFFNPFPSFFSPY